MFITLPANTPVDLYAATKIPSGEQINAYNPTDVPVLIHPGAGSPSGIYSRLPLSPKSQWANNADKTKNPGFWAIAVHADTQVFVTAVTA